MGTAYFCPLHCCRVTEIDCQQDKLKQLEGRGQRWETEDIVLGGENIALLTDNESDHESNWVALRTDLLERSSSCSSLLLSNSRDDFGKLKLNSRVILWKFSDPSEVGQSSILFVLGSEPSRGLLEEWEKHDHDTNGNKLETNRDSPLDGTSSRVHLGNTIIDPVREGYRLSA